MRTVIELLHQAAEQFDDMPYLGSKLGSQWQIYSFSETDRLSSAFAAALLRQGFTTGDHISILSEGRSSWVIGEFGILKAGCISVPLSTKLVEEEIIFRLEHSEAKALLVSEGSFQRAVDSLRRGGRKPALIIISPHTPTLETLMERNHFSGEILFYDDLISEGKQLLDQSVEGSGFREKLAEIEKSISSDDMVTISYTSGTTGNPKGTMLSHRNYLHNAENALKIVHVEKGWKSLLILPLDHSFAHTVGLYTFLIKGMGMYFIDSQGGPMAILRNLPRNLLEVNPDFLLTVPALTGNFMRKMIQAVNEQGKLAKGFFNAGLKAGIARVGNGYNRPSLFTRMKNYFPWAIANVLIFPRLRAIFGKDIQFCIGGGALLELKQQEFFNAIGVPVYQGYGLTENSPIICANSAEKHKFGTSGIIIPNLDVRIMKDHDTECAAGETGEIITRGDSVMKGYFKNPTATDQTLIDGWLWTGDLGYKDTDGFLVVTGRAKALLIAPDGEKYSPETIETAIINTSRLVNQIMAYNEQCKFTSALVTLHPEEIKTLMNSRGLSPHSSTDLDRLINLIKDDLLAFTQIPKYAGVPAQWRPASFAIIPQPFEENDGLVNSTLKLVRHNIREFYRFRLDEIYSVQVPDPLLEGNRNALKAILES